VLRFAFLCLVYGQFFVQIVDFTLERHAANRSNLPNEPWLRQGDRVWRWGGPLSRDATPLDRFKAELDARERFARFCLEDLLRLQLIVLLILTPAVSCGTLSREKEHGTLQALFCTQLTASGIVLGKLLGRVMVLTPFLFAGLPVLVLLTITADLNLYQLVQAVVAMLLLVFAVAAASILAAVCTRTTRDAVLGCYATLTLTVLTGMVVTGHSGLPLFLDPLEVMRQLAEPLGMSLDAWLASITVWSAAAITCIAVAAATLRGVWIGQLHDHLPRWHWAMRRRVDASPIRWREQHVIGLAPLPWLRNVPRWLAMVAVFAFSSILAFWALDHLTGRLLRDVFQNGVEPVLIERLRSVDSMRLQDEIILMGAVLALIGILVLAVRSTTSISEEKRRKTWEDLVLTPLTIGEIGWQKLQGILLAMPPYLAMYLLPMFALSMLGGWLQFLLAVFCAGVAVASMVLVAIMGMWWSLRRAESSEA
jgi:ABC-type transport system involved in multi-copper enzyme maturation permease subunit